MKELACRRKFRAQFKPLREIGHFFDRFEREHGNAAKIREMIALRELYSRGYSFADVAAALIYCQPFKFKSPSDVLKVRIDDILAKVEAEKKAAIERESQAHKKTKILIDSIRLTCARAVASPISIENQIFAVTEQFPWAFNENDPDELQFAIALILWTALAASTNASAEAPKGVAPASQGAA